MFSGLKPLPEKLIIACMLVFCLSCGCIDSLASTWGQTTTGANPDFFLCAAGCVTCILYYILYISFDRDHSEVFSYREVRAAWTYWRLLKKIGLYHVSKGCSCMPYCIDAPVQDDWIRLVVSEDHPPKRSRSPRRYSCVATTRAAPDDFIPMKSKTQLNIAIKAMFPRRNWL